MFINIIGESYKQRKGQKMIIKNGTKEYQVGELIAETKRYRTYLCTQKGVQQQYLLLISTETEHNGLLDRNAYMLAELEGRSNAIEATWAANGQPGSQFPLNYCLGFPGLVDNFVPDRQGGRRINIVRFREVEDLKGLVPATRMVKKDRLRVDLKTSVWIMGKLLKLLVFTQWEGISSGWVEPKNILLELNKHYVLLFGWMEAKIRPQGVPADVQRQEVKQAARAVIFTLGGNPETGSIPNDGEEHFDRYSSHLAGLARGNARCAREAHTAFYELVNELWERKFHPYQTHPT